MQVCVHRKGFREFSHTPELGFVIFSYFFFLFRESWKPGEMLQLTRKEVTPFDPFILKNGQTYFKNPAVFTPQDF